MEIKKAMAIINQIEMEWALKLIVLRIEEKDNTTKRVKVDMIKI